MATVESSVNIPEYTLMVVNGRDSLAEEPPVQVAILTNKEGEVKQLSPHAETCINGKCEDICSDTVFTKEQSNHMSNGDAEHDNKQTSRDSTSLENTDKDVATVTAHHASTLESVQDNRMNDDQASVGWSNSETLGLLENRTSLTEDTEASSEQELPIKSQDSEFIGHNAPSEVHAGIIQPATEYTGSTEAL